MKKTNCTNSWRSRKSGSFALNEANYSTHVLSDEWSRCRLWVKHLDTFSGPSIIYPISLTTVFLIYIFSSLPPFIYRKKGELRIKSSKDQIFFSFFCDFLLKIMSVFESFTIFILLKFLLLFSY